MDTDYKNLEQTMGKIFLHNIFNWDQIKDNLEVMSSVDMETNSMCNQLKQQNPGLRDQFIQAYVLSFLMMMILVVSIPPQNIVDNIQKTMNGASTIETQNLPQNTIMFDQYDVD